MNSAIVNPGFHVATTVIKVAGVAGHEIQGLIERPERAVQMSQGWTRHDPGGASGGGGGSEGSNEGDGSGSVYGTGDDEYGPDRYTPDDRYDDTGITNGANFGAATPFISIA